MSAGIPADALVAPYDALLVDLDGVVFAGGKPIPGAAETLATARAAEISVCFVTNNASRTPAQVAEHLQEMGAAATPDEVLTAAHAGVAVMSQSIPVPGPVLVVGADGLMQAARDAGYHVVETASENPVAVIQGFGRDVGWRHLAEAAFAIQQGAAFFATNVDTTLPQERGFAPGNGALVGAVEVATGVTPMSAGKPAPDMFHMAQKILGATRPLAIGDRLDTDIRGARAAGIDSLHVLTGVSDAIAVAHAPVEDRPTYIASDMTALMRPYPAIFTEETVTKAGAARAEVTADVLHIRGEGIDAIRAGCVATWDATDADGTQTVDTSALSGLGYVHGRA